MKTISKQDLKDILDKHNKWIRNQDEGSRADLSGADLYGTIYEDNAIVNFQYQKHTATYMGTNEIRIGCHVHDIQYWMDNFEKIGKDNNYNEEQIKRYGKFIRSCAKDFANSKK